MKLKDGKLLSEDELRSFQTQIRSDTIPNHLEIILQYGTLPYRAIHIPGDLELDGDLLFNKEKIQVLIVDGDLTISGRLQDRFDEEIESLLLVKGSLYAKNFFTFGSVEVHGDVIVQEHLMLIENACLIHIHGNLRTLFAYNVNHRCIVEGSVEIDQLLQNGGFVITEFPPDYIHHEGEEVAGVLNHELIVGDIDEDDETEFGMFVEYVPHTGLIEWIIEGKSIFIEEESQK